MSTLRSITRTLAATVAAVVLLAAATSTCSARNLSVSNQNLRMTWRSVEFVAPEVITIRCQLTLEGSFHSRTIAKVRESLIGAITRAGFKTDSCTGGSWSAKAETLPWHLTYEGFTGALPNISAVQLGLSRFRFEISSPFCTSARYGSTTDKVTSNANREPGGGITSLEPITGRNTVTLITTPTIGCTSTATMARSAEVMLLGTTTRITITLI